MSREFTDADIVQSDTGSATSAGTLTATLPAVTTEGNAGMVVMGGGVFFQPPDQWHVVASAGSTDETNANIGIACRADIPAGESSWPFPLATPSQVLWTIAEWTNISFCPVVGSDFQPFLNSPSSFTLSASQQGDVLPAYTLAIAATLSLPGAGSTAWSPVTWSGGFVETDVLTQGTGTAGGDMQLRVARRYGTLNETGPWDTTCTFTSPQTLTSIYGALGVFRAENFVGDI